MLYRLTAGQPDLVQKIRQPFMISECRFLANDRFLFTYHELGSVSTKMRFANYIWRLTAAGLQAVMLLRDPAVQVTNRRGGQFQFADQTASSGRPATQNRVVSRGLLPSADGHYILAHTPTGQADSLWWIGDQVQRIASFDQRTTTRTLSRASTDPPDDALGRTLTVPDAGFIDKHLWFRNTTDSTISLYRLQGSTRTVVPLPNGVRTLFGYSAISHYGVFGFASQPDIPELWHYRTGKWFRVQQLPTPGSDYTGAWPDNPLVNLISPDGQLLVVPTSNAHLRVYHLSGTETHARYQPGRSGKTFYVYTDR